jgi:F0F1-type ATP synthase membrane subunit b/b'
MNKSEEIAAWKAFAASIPPDSTYASMREAEDIRAAAMREAHEIKEDARKRAHDEAGRIVDEARQKADLIRGRALTAIREATRNLEA